MLINDADVVYVGDISADRVYYGELLVWEANGDDPTGYGRSPYGTSPYGE
jgi:hypothetical protein